MSLTKLSLMRNSHLSLFYKIKNSLALPIEQEELIKVSSGIYKTKKTNWVENIIPNVFIDEVKVENPIINYNDFTISVENPLNQKVTSSYSYCPVHIYQDYPDVTKPDFKTPSVSVLHVGTDEKPYQLTYGKKIRRYYLVDIFADRSGQRDDLAEVISQMFDEDIPIIDFNLGFPILGDGTINPNYSQVNQTIGSLELDSINLTPERSIVRGKAEKYVMSIDVSLVSYRD